RWGHEAEVYTERMQLYGAGKELAKRKKETLQKSVETRRYNVSIDGLSTKVDDLTKKLDGMEAEGEEGLAGWTPEEHDDYVNTSAELLRNQAELVIRVNKREHQLRVKLADLEKSLAQGLDGNAFEGALEALRFISRTAEDTLKEAFGDHYDAVFAN